MSSLLYSLIIITGKDAANRLQDVCISGFAGRNVGYVKQSRGAPKMAHRVWSGMKDEENVFLQI